MKARIVFLLVFLASAFVLQAQVDLGKGFRKDKKGQEAFIRGEEYYDRGDYLLALPWYRSLESQYGSSDYLIFRIGICLLYKSDETESALEYLLKVKEKNPKAADIDLYVARAYHLNGRYDEAIASVDTYLSKKSTPPEKQEEAKRLKQYCENAKLLSENPVDVKIRNLGGPVNTENSEYVPVVSSDDSVMLFTYRGTRSTGGLQSYPGQPDSSGIYFEDVFYTFFQNGTWQEPVALDSTINGDGHDACIAISNDGQTLLIYKDNEGNGDIYTSTLSGFYWSAPVPLFGYVNSPSWEGSATFSSDMRTLYFASDRPGGYGGRDIWVATIQPDGRWGSVKNLGPKVNTPYNEDAPFLHPNNVTLIFSSEGHNSMGGYDIFRTDLTPIDSTYAEPSPPVNIGFPINTPGDDKYFVLGTDGMHGYYSSGKSGGEGQQDIYIVSGDFKLGNANVLLLTGTITLDGAPVKAEVHIRDKEGRFSNFQVTSNPHTGKYLVSLPVGTEYKITYELPGGDDREVREVNGKSVSGMRRDVIDIQFYSSMAARSQAQKKDSLADSANVVQVKPLRQSFDTTIFKLFPLDSLTLRLLNPFDYNNVLKVYGNASKEGLIFRVQIAAYNFPENYNSSHLLALGSIDRIRLDDGIMRFTMGQFKTIGEAEAYRQKIIAAGQTDAFVTAEVNGKRYLIKELVALHFFQDIQFFENHPLNRK